MGLALHNSSDALDLLSQDLLQVSRLRPGTHYRGAFLRVDGTLSLSREHAHQRLPLLDLILLRNHQRETQRPRQTRRRHQHNRSTQQWRYDEAAEGRALAALASVRLPGSTAPQRRRTPPLERQNAFREPHTTKSRMTQRVAREDKDIAELYRLGLLYDDDDEQIRDEEFQLDSIIHSEPGYTVRPAKKAHKEDRAQQYSFEDDLQFALDLSLAELGHDESFASHLLPPDLDDISSADESTDPPSRFISEPMGSPHSFSDDLPDLTTDSDSDHASLDSSSVDEFWTTAQPKDGTGRIGDVADHDGSDNACMGLGDGS